MNIKDNKNTLAQIEARLKGAITDYAESVIPDTENPAYRVEIIRMFADEGADFLIACMRKFASGQLKYGGNFFQADLPKEARQEHIDMFNYNAGISRRTKYPHVVNIVEESEGIGE